MRNIAKLLMRSEFTKHVSVLASGSVLAQFILLASSPILTRLYGPEGFAALALFMAMISAISPGISGRYEVAIVVAETPEDSRSFLVISIWIAMGLCTSLATILFLFFEKISAFLNAGALGHLLMLVPLGLFMLSTIVAMRYFANSRKEYAIISRLVVGQAIVTTGFSILFGLKHMQMHGLILALLLGYGFAIIYITFIYRTELRSLNFRLTPERRALARRYKDFPIYNASTSVLNGITLAFAVFFLTKHYPEAIVGYYALLTRVATSPLKFISQAVSQVHVKKVSELVISETSIGPYLTRISLLLTVVVSVPTVIFMIAGPSIFAIVFGEEWREAGTLLVILMPAIAIKFVVSTLSSVFSSTGNNHLGAVWRITAMIVIFSMFISLSGKVDVHKLFIAMMATDVILYLLYYGLIWKAACNPKRYAK